MQASGFKVERMGAPAEQSCLGDKIAPCPRCNQPAYRVKDRKYVCFSCHWKGELR